MLFANFALPHVDNLCPTVLENDKLSIHIGNSTVPVGLFAMKMCIVLRLTE